jgi:hypothetical protein
MTDRAREQAERIMRAVTSLECCPQCYEPKFPQGQEAGEEKALGWPGCVNPQCVACGEQQCSVAFRDPSERLEECEPELRESLLRSAMRRNGSLLWRFKWYPRKKKRLTFEEHMWRKV